MIDFLYGGPKRCQLFKVLVVLPVLEKFLREPMRLLNFLKLENRTAAGADPEIGHGG